MSLSEDEQREQRERLQEEVDWYKQKLCLMQESWAARQPAPQDQPSGPLGQADREGGRGTEHGRRRSAASAGGEAMQKRARVDGSCGSRAGGPRVFLGYRVDSDQDLVKRLYDKLVSKGIDVWWDVRSLPRGQPWEEGFADGLCSSDVFVPVISKAALAPFASLTPESRCDNVLLEHQLALELKMRGELRGIFPVLVGVLEHHGELGEIYGDFFKGHGIPSCPEVIVGSVEAKLKEHLFRKEKGVPQLPDATRKVAGTLKAITEHQGVQLSGIKRDAVQDVVDEIVRACGAHRASPFVQHESAHTCAREGDDSEAGVAKRADKDSREGSKAAEKRPHDAGKGWSSHTKTPRQDSASARMPEGGRERAAARVYYNE